MRHLISSICALGVLGAPMSALAADRKADLRDARCIAAIGVLAAQKKAKKSDEAFFVAAMLYSLGRLEGRNETVDLSGLWAEALVDETETTLLARAGTCAEDMSRALESIQSAEMPE